MIEAKTDSEALDALNQHARQICAAFSTLENDDENTPIEIAWARKMPNGIVFVPRCRSLTYVLGTMGSFSIAISALYRPTPFLFWLFCLYWYVDFYGCVLHVVLDDPRTLEWSVLRSDALLFQWHHRIPYESTTRSFVEYVGGLNTLLSIRCVTVMVFTWLFQNDWTDGAVLFACSFVWGIAGHWSHRLCHTSEKKRTFVGIWLQKGGIFVDPDRHLLHHTGSGSEYSILSGHAEPVIRHMLGWCRHLYFWGALMVGLTLFDSALFLLLFRSVREMGWF